MTKQISNNLFDGLGYKAKISLNAYFKRNGVNSNANIPINDNWKFYPLEEGGGGVFMSYTEGGSPVLWKFKGDFAEFDTSIFSDLTPEKVVSGGKLDFNTFGIEGSFTYINRDNGFGLEASGKANLGKLEMKLDSEKGIHESNPNPGKIGDFAEIEGKCTVYEPPHPSYNNDGDFVYYQDSYNVSKSAALSSDGAKKIIGGSIKPPNSEGDWEVKVNSPVASFGMSRDHKLDESILDPKEKVEVMVEAAKNRKNEIINSTIRKDGVRELTEKQKNEIKTHERTIENFDKQNKNKTTNKAQQLSQSPSHIKLNLNDILDEIQSGISKLQSNIS